MEYPKISLAAARVNANLTQAEAADLMKVCRMFEADRAQDTARGEVMRLLRLKKLLEDTPIGLNGYAKLLDMNNRTLYNKLTGKSHFTYPEYLKLRELFPDRNIDYLLTAEQDSA